MNNNKSYLSIVISQYNELNNLKRGVLDEVKNYLKTFDRSYEVVIVDDGSTDGGYDFTKKFGEKLPKWNISKIVHGGKAKGLNQGIKLAEGEWILLTDMDQSTPLSEIQKLLPYTNEYDVIIGSRSLKREGNSLIRKVASSIFYYIRKCIVLWDIKDTQCGFKLFRADVIKRLFPRLEVLNEKNVKGWSVSAFDVELLFMARINNYKIKEVVVQWNNEDTSTTKKRKFIKESLNMLKQLFFIKWNHLKGKYRIGGR